MPWERPAPVPVVALERGRRGAAVAARPRDEQILMWKPDIRPIPRHEPLQERDGMVLLRSKKDPRVRRWQHQNRQVPFVLPQESELLLKEVAAAGKGGLGMTRRRAELPHVNHLIGQGYLDIETNPAHHVVEYGVKLTEYGHRYLHFMAERDSARAADSQAPLFKGRAVVRRRLSPCAFSSSGS